MVHLARSPDAWYSSEISFGKSAKLFNQIVKPSLDYADAPSSNLQVYPGNAERNILARPLYHAQETFEGGHQ